MQQTFEQAAQAYFEAEMELNTAIRFGTLAEYNLAYAWWMITKQRAWALAPVCAACGGPVHPIHHRCDCDI